MTTPPKGQGSTFGTLLLKRTLWFGVGVAAGLAPFLGKLRVPGFNALIETYPFEMQNWLIPVSGLLMGFIALVVEYEYEGGIAKKKRDLWFKRTIVTFAVSLLLLLGLYVFAVARVEKTVTAPGEEPRSVTIAAVTGSPEVPGGRAGCACEAGAPAEECLEKSIKPANIRRCFGATRVALATIALAIVYFTLTGSLAAGVGLLVIKQTARPRRTPATIPP